MEPASRASMRSRGFDKLLFHAYAMLFFEPLFKAR